MKQELNELCTNFIENRNKLQDTFVWENPYMYPICASILISTRMTVDVAKLQECKKIFKQNTGLFSNFRIYSSLMMICKLATSPNPQKKMEDTMVAYDELKKCFFSSPYLPLVATVLTDFVEPLRYPEIALRTRQIYDLMKDEHPFLTSGEDSVLAALLALSDHTPEEIVEKIELCYNILKGHFFSPNAVQSLSHVLALDENCAPQKCGETIQLFHVLQDSGHNYSIGCELSTLGVLTMIPAELDDVKQDIIDVDDFLSTQKGYGFFGIGEKRRLMHAGMIVASYYINEPSVMNPVAVKNTLPLIVAQQLAICILLTTSSTLTTLSDKH